MYNQFTKTIAAISTARYTSALAIVRISGNETFQICDKCVVLPSHQKVSDMEGNTCKYCKIVAQDGTTIDTGIITIYRSPKSATGEDVAEITCHGGVLVSSLVLERIYECGALHALRAQLLSALCLGASVGSDSNCVSQSLSSTSPSCLSQD